MPPGKQRASLTVQEPQDHCVLALALGNTHQCPPSTPKYYEAITMKSSSFELESKKSLGYHLRPNDLGFASQALPWSMLYLGACMFIFKEPH